jgi:hypothetical protein
VQAAPPHFGLLQTSQQQPADFNSRGFKWISQKKPKFSSKQSIDFRVVVIKIAILAKTV